MQSPAHHTIVTGLQQRDPQIIGWLYTTYAPRLLGYFTRRLRDPDLARDLHHDLFLRLLERAPAFVDRGVPIDAWLFRLAHDLVVDTHRHAGRTVPLTDAAHFAADDDVAITCLHATDHATLNQAITTLPHAYQRVLTLRFRDTCSLADTARQLGLSLSATKALQRRAITHLCALLCTSADDASPSPPLLPADGMTPSGGWVDPTCSVHLNDGQSQRRGWVHPHTTGSTRRWSARKTRRGLRPLASLTPPMA